MELESLVVFLNEIENSRKAKGKRHKQLSILIIIIMAMLCGRTSLNFIGMSILDLKAWFRAGKCVRETLKLLPHLPERISIDVIVSQVASLGRINSPSPVV